MNFEAGSFSRGSTGAATILLDGVFTPQFFEFEIGPRSGTTETDIRSSTGWQDLVTARKYCKSVYSDGVNPKTRETTSYSFAHYVGNTKVLSGYVTGSASGEFYITMDTVDSNYIIRVKAFA